MAQDNKVDPDRSHADAPFDRDSGFSGQGYRADDERALGRAMPSGQVPPPGTGRTVDAPASANAEADLPSDNGKRPVVDAVTGAAMGTGMGAGGGQPGEDMDEDSASGDGPVITGQGSRSA